LQQKENGFVDQIEEDARRRQTMINGFETRPEVKIARESPFVESVEVLQIDYPHKSLHLKSNCKRNWRARNKESNRLDRYDTRSSASSPFTKVMVGRREGANASPSSEEDCV
jgi:hypothetical protein